MPKKSNPKPKIKPGTSSPQPNPPPPPWPSLDNLPITPLLPIPLYPPTTTTTPTNPYPSPPAPKILTISTFFPRSLTRTFLSLLRTLPLATTPPPPARLRAEMAARVNDRFQVQDARFAEQLWTRTGLRDVLAGEGAEEWVSSLWGGQAIGLNPNIRIYRYSAGQFFDCHYDESNAVMVPSPDDPDRLVPARTTWTLLLYLTSGAEGCVGGETVFYPNDNKSPEEALVVAPETGMLLLHKHGDDCMLHEGRVVTAGEKWILRTDICIRK